MNVKNKQQRKASIALAAMDLNGKPLWILEKNGDILISEQAVKDAAVFGSGVKA